MNTIRSITSVALLLCLTAVAWFAGCAADKPQQATDFTLKDLSGKSWTLSDFKGKSAVFVHFGTTWCPPCVADVPNLNALQQKYGNRLAILYVDSSEAETVVRNFVADKGIKYTTLLDADGRVAEQYGVEAIPHNILIDKQGLILSRTVDLPEKKIEDLLGK